MRQPPKQPRAHETKLHVLQTAAGLYAIKKQEEVHMSHIVRSAHISQGTIYRYFGNLPELWQFAAEVFFENTQVLANQIFAVAARDPKDLVDKWIRLYLALSPLRRESQGLITMSRLYIYGVDIIPYSSQLRTQTEEWKSRSNHVFVQCGATKAEEEVLVRYLAEQYLAHLLLCRTESSDLEYRSETLSCAGRLQSLMKFKGVF